MNRIGLDEHKSTLIVEKLNGLLSNYQLFYMNTRGFHWNVKGEDFFEMHLKFEELYNDSKLKIDEIAERIVTLGNVPLHSYSDYIAHSEIEEVKNIHSGKRAAEQILKGFKILLKVEREILNISDEANDEGTNSLMSDYIREQEKLSWMYHAYLS